MSELKELLAIVINKKYAAKAMAEEAWLDNDPINKKGYQMAARTYSIIEEMIRERLPIHQSRMSS